MLPGREVSVEVSSQLPVVAERAMYWNGRSDGHASIGSPSPDTRWFLPEGYTGPGFETWVLVQNPGEAPVSVTATFMEPSGAQTIRSYTVGARSRFTIPVHQLLPGREVSISLDSTGPVIVEEAMYWARRSGGSGSIGIRGR